MADYVSSTEESEEKETEFKVPGDSITNSHNNVVDGNVVRSSDSAASIGSVRDVSDVVLVCASDSGNSIEGPVNVLKSDCADTLLFGNSAALDCSVLADRDQGISLPPDGSNGIQNNEAVPMDGLEKCDTTSPTGCCDTTDDSDRRDKFELSSVGGVVSEGSIADSFDKSDSLSLDVETNGSSSGVITDSVSSGVITDSVSSGVITDSVSSGVITDSVSGTALGQLTKDDSGIDVTPSSSANSPPKDQDTSGRPQSEAANGLDERPASTVKTERRMATDDDDDDTLAGVTVRNEIVMLMDTDDDDSQQPLDSDADDDDDDDALTDDKSANSSGGEDDVMQVDLTPPTDGWCAVREIRRREIGYAAQRVPTSKLFVQRTGGSIQLARRLKLQHKLEHHEGCVNCLHFNESGTLLASGSDDLNIVIWNWGWNKPYLVFDSGHRENVFQSKFMPYCGDTHIISCARDGHIRLAELSSTGICKNTKKLAQHHGSAHKVALLQDSSHVCYSCGEDATVFEIDLRASKPNKLCVTKENDRKVALYSIHSNPFKSYEYCVGGRDQFIRVYDKRMINEKYEGALLKKFCPHHLMNAEFKTNITCSVYNYNGTEILGTYNDEDIYLFDNGHSDGADFTHRYRGHRNNATVKGVNFYGPRSEFIVSGSDCGNVFLWEKNSEKIVNYFQADKGGVINVLEPHPYSPILATSGLDHDVKVWSPTAANTAKLDSLPRVMRRNRREREDERSSEPDMVDGQMLWLLMQRLRRHARNRARQDPGDAAEVSSDSSDSDSDDESEDSEDMPDRLQCAPS